VSSATTTITCLTTTTAARAAAPPSTTVNPASPFRPANQKSGPLPTQPSAKHLHPRHWATTTTTTATTRP